MRIVCNYSLTGKLLLLFGFVLFLQLYARRHFLFPPLSIEDYNDRVRAVVRCEAQVLSSFFFSDQYLNVVVMCYLSKKQRIVCLLCFMGLLYSL